MTRRSLLPSLPNPMQVLPPASLSPRVSSNYKNRVCACTGRGVGREHLDARGRYHMAPCWHLHALSHSTASMHSGEVHTAPPEMATPCHVPPALAVSCVCWCGAEHTLSLSCWVPRGHVPSSVAFTVALRVANVANGRHVANVGNGVMLAMGVMVLSHTSYLHACSRMLQCGRC